MSGSGLETPNELCARIESDVDKLLQMYDLAARAYPYENIHGPRALSDANQRLNMQKFASSDDPAKALSEGSAMPILFLYMMSRPGAAHFLDFSQIFKSPSRALGWLCLGNSIIMIWKMKYISQTRQNNP